MAPEEEIDRLSATGARMTEIIKPYRDRELIFRKIQHAEGKKLLAVGIDIDHPFGEDGTADIPAARKAIAGLLEAKNIDKLIIEQLIDKIEFGEIDKKTGRSMLKIFWAWS